MPENRSRFVLLCQQSLALGLVAAVAVPAAQLVTLDIIDPHAPGRDQGGSSSGPAPSSTAETSVVAAAPVRPTTRTVPLRGISRDGLAALGEPSTGAARTGGTARLSAADVEPGTRVGDRLAVLSAPQSVEGLSTVGVTWGEGTRLAEDGITVSVRTQSDGVWSAWTTAPYHEEEGPDPTSAEGSAARPGTDPVYVGDVDDVQVKAVTDDGTAPADMALAVVDPGDAAKQSEKPSIDTGALALSSAESASADASTDEDADGGAELSAGVSAAKPTIFSRAQWGADERMRDKSSLHYGKVSAGFVHHTVNANNYTEAQVPSIIRGIYAYHTQSRGWSDVGYNFLVDRFGRIWEGRYGGVDKAVVGAHTSGYNDDAFAMSAIGNFEQVQPSSALLDAYGRLFAWKLGLSGISATATRQWVSKRYLPAINGHRDVGQTACPGKYLFAKIPTIRTLADGYQKKGTPTTPPPTPPAPAPTPSARDRATNLLDGREPEIVVRDRTTKDAYVVQTGGTPVAYGAGTVARSGLSGADLVAAVGDLTGDGKADVLARVKATGRTSIHPGNGAGLLGAPVKATTLFARADQLIDAGDWNGDGKADVVARDKASKALDLYLGNGAGGFAAPKRLATGWSAYTSTVGGGDFTGDGLADLVARSTSGTLVVLPGTRTGAAAVRVVSTGWAASEVVGGLDDLTNDGRRDLVARHRATGVTRVYRGDGAGGYLASPVMAPRADGLTVVGAGNYTGSAAPDLMVRTPAGQLLVLANNGGTVVGKAFPTGQTMTAADLVMVAGDWDRDGHADVVTRSGATGALYLYRGTGKGALGAPVKMATGFEDVGLLAAVGDLTGDGLPDLVGQPASGSMRVYPGDGESGLTASKAIRSAVSTAVPQQLGIGRWDADAAPDTVLRRGDGRLVLNRGTTAGALTPNSATLGTLGDGYDWAVAGGDVTGDGRPDLLVRETATGTLWNLPGTSTGLASRRQVATGLARFDLAG